MKKWIILLTATIIVIISTITAIFLIKGKNDMKEVKFHTNEDDIAFVKKAIAKSESELQKTWFQNRLDSHFECLIDSDHQYVYDEYIASGKKVDYLIDKGQIHYAATESFYGDLLENHDFHECAEKSIKSGNYTYHLPRLFNDSYGGVSVVKFIDNKISIEHHSTYNKYWFPYFAANQKVDINKFETIEKYNEIKNSCAGEEIEEILCFYDENTPQEYSRIYYVKTNGNEYIFKYIIVGHLSLYEAEWSSYERFTLDEFIEKIKTDKS